MERVLICQGTRRVFGFFSRSLRRQTGLGSSFRCISTSADPNTSTSSSSNLLLEGYPLDSEDCNVPFNIAQRVGSSLHRRPLHPLGILHKHILDYFKNDHFQVYDNLSPIVTTERNFDSLRIPADHVSRNKSDTYYLNKETVLRTHTSAHQVDLLQKDGGGVNRFLVSGDVYRRDEIDRSHYPIFHQMEGVKVFTAQDYNNSSSPPLEQIEQDLKSCLEGLAVHLFGPDTKMRWVDTYFPFTHPSMELEIYFDNEWLEVLGCGVIHPTILKNAARGADEQGWAFGLGLERLAMVLFDIPDIRLFWTNDERFHRQFESGEIVPFQPYSKYPHCYKDVSFWINDEYKDAATNAHHANFHVNDFNELIRDIAGDLVEQVSLIDDFRNPKTGRTSHCYRIFYRSMDRSLTNEEIDALQVLVRERTVRELGVELR